jgi:hypothetical protein
MLRNPTGFLNMFSLWPQNKDNPSDLNNGTPLEVHVNSLLEPAIHSIYEALGEAHRF